MAEAYIIDAVRTPRSIGKMGKGALSAMHPEHLSASVLAALAERNNLNTADVDDVIWGVSAGMGLQAGDTPVEVLCQQPQVNCQQNTHPSRCTPGA